jgi:MFS family permease
MPKPCITPNEQVLDDARPAPPAAWPVATVSLAALLSSLGTSSANVALPTLADAFAASFASVQWVVLAYLLAITALIVGAGRLGDVVGRRRLLLGGILLFAVASAVCGGAPDLGTLIAARALQGTAAAVLMALSVALVADIVPVARTGRVMGLLGATSAIGTALGPSLGGALIGAVGWRAIFLLNVPVALCTFALARRHLPADRGAPREGARFDVLGTLLLTATLACASLAVTLGRGSLGARNAALALAATIGAALFVAVEARVPSPLIHLSTFRSPTLRASLATSALVATVVMATLVVGPFHLTHALGLGPARVGAVMSVGPLVAALTGVPAGRLVERLGAPRALVAGLAGMCAAAVSLSLVPTAAGVAGYVGPVAVLTGHYALFQAANQTAGMAAAGADQRGVVSGLLALSRNLGLVAGASAMGVVFARASGTSDVAAASAAAIGMATRVTFAVASGLIVLALVIAFGGARAPARPRHLETADAAR